MRIPKKKKAITRMNFRYLEEGRKEGRKSIKEGRKEGRKGIKEGRKEGRKEERVLRKDGRKAYLFQGGLCI